MIQELFAGNTTLIGGGGGGGGGDNNNNISKLSNITPSSSPLSCTTTSNSNITPAAAAASANASPCANSENLRCPRCDSPNTKFCYYNNYNLTQPRHFCKTCRRYWTKGGALRNVPIGGGCRKNKTITTAKSTAAKLKNSLPFELIGKSGIFGGFEQEIIPSTNNPFLFSSPPHQNHNPILSILKGNHHNLNFVKEEHKSIGVNSYNQFPSNNGLSGLWKNNYQENIGEVQNNSGFQELYQRLKASTNRCYPDIHGPSSSSSSMILDSAPVAGGESGFWNPTLSTWLDLPTANGAYL